MVRIIPEVFVIPRELSVEFQTVTQQLTETQDIEPVVKDWYENLAYIYHEYQPQVTEHAEFDRAVVLFTEDESRAFESAYQHACESFEDINAAEKTEVYTALAIHTLETKSTIH